MYSSNEKATGMSFAKHEQKGAYPTARIQAMFRLATRSLRVDLARSSARSEPVRISVWNGVMK